MTAIGWVGLGRLGLPCAAALAHSGHNVFGYDLNPAVGRYLASRNPEQAGLDYLEPDMDDLDLGRFAWCRTVNEVVSLSDIVFVAVQTPHDPRYGGETPAPEQTSDFEYAFLVSAVRQVADAAADTDRTITLVVVSTVLPGTTDRLLRPLLPPNVRLVYSPQFVAMGTVLRDFRNPEFVLAGCDDTGHTAPVLEALAWAHARHTPTMVTDIRTAEMTKVAYNTFISLKIAWANHLAMVCDTVGANAGHVTQILSAATDRVVSPAYMKPGMGDGGGCHPRDLIALSHLEQLHGLPPLYGSLAALRDVHTQWLAKTATSWSDRTGMPVVVYGRAYKPNTHLTDGSPALLLRHYLQEEGAEVVEPNDEHDEPLTEPAVVMVATRHPGYATMSYPVGSVVIDPFGYIEDQPGVLHIRPGRR